MAYVRGMGLVRGMVMVRVSVELAAYVWNRWLHGSTVGHLFAGPSASALRSGVRIRWLLGLV